MAGVFSGKAEAADAICEGEVEKLHAKIGQLVVERDFCRKLPVDEPGPEATDGRSRAPAAFDPAAVPAGVDQPLGLLLPAGGRDAAEPAADEAPGSASWRRHGMAHARWPAVCAGRAIQSAASGSGGSWPRWAWRRSTRRRARPSRIPSTGFIGTCFATWWSNGRTRSGAPTSPTSDAARFPVLGGGNGLGDPQGAELATVQHHGRGLLHRGPAGGASCLIPGFDGAFFTPQWREALWTRYSMGAPQRQRRSVERYSIVKRA